MRTIIFSICLALFSTVAAQENMKMVSAVDTTIKMVNAAGTTTRTVSAADMDTAITTKNR